MDAPERIWAENYTATYRLVGPSKRWPDLTEYVRADLYARLAAENERLTQERDEALRQISDDGFKKRLRNAYERNDMEAAARALSGRLRQMEKKAAAANKARERAEAAEKRFETLKEAYDRERNRPVQLSRAALSGGKDGE